MNIDVAANKRFLDTSAQPAADDWDTLLVNQVDVTIATELELLMRLNSWSRAEHVIDAGCGNGYYVSRLADFFPDKGYLGIDISPALTAAAAARYPEIEFRAEDFFAGSPPTGDVLIMRYLVQHLGDFGAILRQARRALTPGGALVVIESDLERSMMIPLPTTFLQMLGAYNAASAAGGGLKGQLLGDIAGLVAATGEPWRLEQEVEAATTLVGPFADHDIIRVFRMWVDLAERSAMFAFDFNAVRDELAAWGREPVSFVKLVTRMFVLQPTVQ